MLFFRYSVLPEWYVHEEPVVDDKMKEANENVLSNGQETKKKVMLGQDSMTVWERSELQYLPGMR